MGEEGRAIFRADILYILSVFSLLVFIRADIVLGLAMVYMPLHFYLTSRMHLLRQYCVVILLAVLWVYGTREYYQYNKDFVVLFGGLNAFPITTRVMGFMGVYVLYTHTVRFLGISGFWKKFFLFSLSLNLLHLVLEKIGHDYWGIRNAFTAEYPGLPFCECLHAPPWMQAGYLLLGPIFFALVYFLGFDKENSVTSDNE